jgi:hypothetical protein
MYSPLDISGLSYITSERTIFKNKWNVTYPCSSISILSDQDEPTHCKIYGSGDYEGDSAGPSMGRALLISFINQPPSNICIPASGQGRETSRAKSGNVHKNASHLAFIAFFNLS